MIAWTDCAGFDWDAGNSDKNWTKHRVSDDECEEIFFNQPVVVRADQPRSGGEARYYALGQTDQGRRLFVAFTLRGKLIRVISARDMNHNERGIYDTYEKSEEKGGPEI
jgi:uncharacterized DUF497 family protein